MVKTKNRSATKKNTVRPKGKHAKIKAVKLTPEQQARLEAFRQFAIDKESRWNAMSPAQQKEEIEAWDRIMKRINDDRKGYRQVFVDT